MRLYTRFIPCLLAMMLALLFLPGCAKAPVIEVVADQNERTLYEDDTAIALTVNTPAGCTGLSVSQLSCSFDIYVAWLDDGADAIDAARTEDPFYCTEPLNTQVFPAETAKVSETETGMQWELTVDFGNDGVYGLLVSATLKNGKTAEVKAPVYVRYPDINIVDDGVSAAWEAYILRNTDEPFFFTCDLDKTSQKSAYREKSVEYFSTYSFYNGANAIRCAPREAIFDTDYASWFQRSPENAWDVKFASDSPVYGEFVLFNYLPSMLRLFSRGFPGDLTSVSPVDTACFPTANALLCCIQESDEERIADSARAAVSYLHGASIDAALYPGAALCLEEGARALEEILAPGMSDFDKVKAIHDWMLVNGNVTRGDEWNAVSPDEQSVLLGTATGFMRGFGGDCMGWSDTFYMLCSMAGLRCSPVSASAIPGGPTTSNLQPDHALNIVQLDGELYYFDVYWDGAGSGYDVPPYTYFCMTSEKAAKTHTWYAPEAGGPPIATATALAVDPVSGQPLA